MYYSVAFLFVYVQCVQPNKGSAAVCPRTAARETPMDQTEPLGFVLLLQHVEMFSTFYSAFSSGGGNGDNRVKIEI